MANTNKFYLGGILIDALYLGENRINKLCLGENVIYNAEPSGPVINVDDYVTFDALEDGLTISLSTNACEYCVDGDGNWKSLSAGSSTTAVNLGHTLSFRATITPTSSAGVGTFTLGKKCNVRGNVMALLYGDSGKDNFSLSGKNYAFYRLFRNCANLIEVSDNFLPATTLATYCYRYMFQSCTGLTKAPQLPATTLQQYCYQYMFTSCSALTTAPILPATTLQRYCYQYMFQSCSKLNYIKAMFTTDPGSSNSSYQARYTYNWVSGVASSGTFVKNSSASWSRTGNHAVPRGWTIQTASS